MRSGCVLRQELHVIVAPETYTLLLVTIPGCNTPYTHAFSMFLQILRLAVFRAVSLAACQDGMATWKRQSLAPTFLPSVKILTSWLILCLCLHSLALFMSVIPALLLESDCGSRIFLNEQPIIIDRMPHPAEGDYLARHSVPLIPAADRTGLLKTHSPPLELIGGEKYRLRVELVHSTHLKFFNPTSATIRLDPRHFQLGFLNDGEPAFADTDKFVLADVPLRYQSRLFIKTLAQPTVGTFSFDVNVPATIFIASLSDEPLPLAPPDDVSWRAHDTEDFLSIYFNVDEQNRALESRMLRIRYISLKDAGSLSFKVVYKDIPFLIFAEQRPEGIYSCGGEEEVLSLVGGHSYASCTASSQESDDFNCEAALNGKHLDQPKGAWHTQTGNGKRLRCSPLRLPPMLLLLEHCCFFRCNRSWRDSHRSIQDPCTNHPLPLQAAR